MREVIVQVDVRLRLRLSGGVDEALEGMNYSFDSDDPRVEVVESEIVEWEHSEKEY